MCFLKSKIDRGSFAIKYRLLLHKKTLFVHRDVGSVFEKGNKSCYQEPLNQEQLNVT